MSLLHKKQEGPFLPFDLFIARLVAGGQPGLVNLFRMALPRSMSQRYKIVTEWWVDMASHRQREWYVVDEAM